MKISIPQPCHENWNEMLPEEKGRFCLSCRKCVLDFTKMPDEEILIRLGGQKPNQCGRFSDRQLENLNRKLREQNQIRFPKIFRYSTFLMAFGFVGNLAAQEKEKTEVVEPKVKSSNQIKSDSILLKVTVVDSDGFPIEDAFVTLQNNNIETITDENGFFEMKIPNGNPKNIITITDSFGISQEFCVADINNNEIKLNYPDFELTETVVTGGISIKRSFTGKILHAIAWPFRQIGKIF